LFGLLAATGMRISEALALRLGDVTADGPLIRMHGPANSPPEAGSIRHPRPIETDT
jgi:integrase